MGLLNTLSTGLFAALINIIGAMTVSKLLPVGFAVGVGLIDSMLTMLATHATNTTMLAATSLLVAIVAMLAKMSADLTVED